MELTIFQADEGDCLLLKGADGKRLLVDGGTPEAYHGHVAPTLEGLRQAGAALDVVYVSHIDGDHIGGVLQMLDDEVAWRVHEYQVRSGNAGHPSPCVPRPSKVNAVWHNGFSEQLQENAGPIEEMLARCARILSGAENAELRALGDLQRNLASSTRQAIQLSRRIGPRQLNIPLNPESRGKMMMVRDDRSSIRLGGASVVVIGPAESEMERLRDEWNKWLKKNKEALQEIDREASADEESLGARVSDWGARLGRESVRAPEISRVLLAALVQAQELGRRGKVTTPNLASLMLLVEEGATTVLLTGDGHAKDIVSGLEHHGKMSSGHLHVNVFKVPHHGSEHNLDRGFCKAVTADHYLFCANGKDDNPDLRIVQAIVDSRLAGSDPRPFKLWFNSSAAATDRPENKVHMAKVERKVKKLAATSQGRMSYMFLEGDDSLQISL